MPTVEEELAELLHSRGHSVPSDPRLLTVVKARSRRKVVRRRVGTALALAATLAAVVFVPATILNRQSQTDGPLPAGGKDPSAVLVAGPNVDPWFPLTPTYLPTGLGKQPQIDRLPLLTSAVYSAAHVEGLYIDVGLSTRRGPDGQAPRSVRVRGAEGSFEGGKDGGRLTWLHKPGTRITVSGLASVGHNWGTLEELTRVANGLREERMTVPGAFSVARAPAGLQLASFISNIVEKRITLASSSSAEDATRDPSAITVTVFLATPERDGRGKLVTIGTRSGWLEKSGRSHSLVLKLSQTVRMSFDVPAGWSEEKLRIFAAGVRYTGPPPTSSQR